MQMYHPKTTAGALGGALSVVLIAELTRRGVDISAIEGSSLTLLIGYVCGYFAPDSDTTQAEVVAAAKGTPLVVTPLRPDPQRSTIKSPVPAVEELRPKGDDLSIPVRPNDGKILGGATGAALAAAFLSLSLLSACAALPAATTIAAEVIGGAQLACQVLNPP